MAPNLVYTAPHACGGFRLELWNLACNLHSKVQLLMRQAVELADYSQKEIQRQDG
jgi:hypothetical protein